MFLYLSADWFAKAFLLLAIKREPGVTPGQSRCCEALIQTFRSDTLLPLARVSREGVRNGS
ncbi:hypothetical protein AE937_04875 [Bacteroides fragilis]|uniref:Uncharacterized protein n=1 Tax=Bacteroides fragilis TaxID=817 RepID=A0A081UJX3_BACFG|nr:hypothetical protein [Bacteroides fragilis]MBY2898933.1 hypothetical protein [Bacteroides fragilis]MBY2901555.1 hypothetical protein [Bacteroides fragilis]OCL20159.1 hypothetical protein AOQ65_01560 [Bacteroides fragilis]OCM97561.1 hypothetical protein AE749_07195 [Bacteroides fragilis]